MSRLCGRHPISMLSVPGLALSFTHFIELQVFPNCNSMGPALHKHRCSCHEGPSRVVKQTTKKSGWKDGMEKDRKKTTKC